MFVPKTATNLLTEMKNNTYYLTYTVNETVISKQLNIIFTTNNTSVWTLISCFKFIVAGDLSFFASSTGRDGRSHCRCTYCPLSSTEWNDEMTCSISNNLTLSIIHTYANMYNEKKKKKKKLPDTKGIIMHPLLDIEPRDYIVPLLHLMIGIVNKTWMSFLFF